MLTTGIRIEFHNLVYIDTEGVITITPQKTGYCRSDHRRIQAKTKAKVFYCFLANDKDLERWAFWSQFVKRMNTGHGMKLYFHPAIPADEKTAVLEIKNYCDCLKQVGFLGLKRIGPREIDQ